VKGWKNPTIFQAKGAQKKAGASDKADFKVLLEETKRVT
jgi:hypothetical protein